MAFHGGHSVRAFRPSRMAGLDEEEQNLEQELSRRVNIERYAQRVRDGLPLFDSLPSSKRQQPTLG